MENTNVALDQGAGVLPISGEGLSSHSGSECEAPLPVPD